jgi:hypothetical protein
MRMPARVLAIAVPCLLFVQAPPGWAAPQRKPNPAPRIVAAKLVDVDRDDKADRVVLTYSEAVTHPADADGRYPFSVSGYAIRSVGGAYRSRTLTIVLSERTSRDISARPAIRYTATRKGLVKDLKRKQAVTQRFYGTVALDADRDGYAAKDCRPTLAWAHPGAVDRPDTGLVDANCDGIDGLRTGPVFVSPLGSDTNAGTIAAPVRTFGKAVSVADTSRDIYLAAGSYPSSLTSAMTRSVYGGYANTWSRRTSNVSTLVLDAPLSLGGSPTLQLLRLTAPSGNADQGTVAVTAQNASAKLEQVGISAAPGASGTTGAPARNSVGLVAKNSTVLVVGGSIATGAGGAGATGAPGTPGGAGSPGAAGAPGECVLGLSLAPGGAGGLSPVAGRFGGVGGLGGTTLTPAAGGSPSLDLTPGGAGGTTGAKGGAGRPGDPGAAGAAGATGATSDGVFNLDTYVPGTSTPGSNGTAGHAGGGGGGGGAQLNLLEVGTGSGGGGGGGAGAAGTGGAAAGGGGGSMAVWAQDSSIVLSGTRVSTTGGGKGGAGGLGGAGGGGGTGGIGGVAGSECADRVGAGGPGGNGGAGGAGGWGGDGSGGPSVGVVRLGSTTVRTTNVSWQIGPAGTSPAGASHQGLRFSILTVS